MGDTLIALILGGKSQSESSGIPMTTHRLVTPPSPQAIDAYVRFSRPCPRIGQEGSAARRGWWSCRDLVTVSHEVESSHQGLRSLHREVVSWSFAVATGCDGLRRPQKAGEVRSRSFGCCLSFCHRERAIGLQLHQKIAKDGAKH